MHSWEKLCHCIVTQLSQNKLSFDLTKCLFYTLFHYYTKLCMCVWFFFLSFSATKPGKQMHLRPLEVLISIRYYGVAILPSNHQHWFKMMHFDSIALISKIFRFTKIKSYFMMLPCSSYRQAKTTHF